MKDRILIIRKNEELTQQEFADRLEVSKNYINLIENGKKTPGKNLIEKICRMFNISQEWLVDGVEPMSWDATKFGEICQEIGVSDQKARQAIMDYWKLSENDKELFWKFVARFMK